MTCETAFDHVPKERSPDRSWARGRTDHRNTFRTEERLERRNDADVVPPVDLRAVGVGRDDRESHLDGAALEYADDVEARTGEHLEHRPVLGHDLGDEPLDARPSGRVRELLDEPRSDPYPLECVLYRKRRLGNYRIAEAVPARKRHHTLFAAFDERPNEGSAVDSVR